MKLKLPAFVRERFYRPRGREVFPPLPPRKQDAACCIAKALPDGRLPIGWCGKSCIRRPAVWRKTHAH